MTDEDKKTLRRLAKIDRLEKHLFKNFHIWTDEERKEITFLIEVVIMRMEMIWKRYHKQQQKADAQQKLAGN